MARILLEAALAMKDPKAAQAALDWLERSGHEDPSLRGTAEKTESAEAMKALLSALLLLVASPRAPPHKPSDSYLAIRVEGSEPERAMGHIAPGAISIFAIGLDDSGGRRYHLGRGEGASRGLSPAYSLLAKIETAFPGKQNVRARATEFLVDDHSDGGLFGDAL